VRNESAVSEREGWREGGRERMSWSMFMTIGREGEREREREREREAVSSILIQHSS
jgi:hypothetical protein